MQIPTGNSRLLNFLAALVIIVGCSAPALSVTTVEVGSCVVGLVQFSTIQSAVNASPSGTIIKVCPGSYGEQVSINKRITLQGVASGTADEAVIVPPSGGLIQNATDVDTGSPLAVQILVVSPATVTIADLTVDATGNNVTGCGLDVIGILFQSASGTVNHAAVRNQALDPADNGCQSGEGIYVQTASGLTSVVAVENTSVHGYQKNGITGNDLGTTLTVTANDIQGQGPTMGAAENGVQLAFGAGGSVTSNLVIDDIYSGPIYGASGILLYDSLESAGIKVNNNTVGNTQLAVALATDEGYGSGQYGDGVTVSGNKIFGTLTFDAVDACTNTNTITNNVVVNSGESAVHLDASCSGNGNNTGNNSTVTGNTILEAGCAGILEDSGTSGNTTSPDTFYTVPTTILNGPCPAQPTTLLDSKASGGQNNTRGGLKPSPRR